MDFGWNKPASQAQNNSTQITTDDVKTPVVDETPAAAPAATPASSWDLPGENNNQESQGGMTVREKDLDFSTPKSDDSFDNDFSVDSSPLGSLAGNDAGNADEAAQDKTEIELPPVEKLEEDKDITIASIEAEDKPAAEIAQSTTLAASGKSLTDLESDISAKRDKVSKDLTDLQEKIKKFDDLLAKVQRMQDDEKNLIQEISSAL